MDQVVVEDKDPNDTIMVPTKFAGGHDGDLSVTVNELLRLVRANMVTITRHEHRRPTMKFLSSQERR